MNGSAAMLETRAPGDAQPLSPGRRAVVTALTGIALAVLLGFLVENRQYIAEHYAPHPSAFALLAALVVATLALRSAAHQALFGRLGIRASAPDWFRLVTVSTFTNYLPLSAGMMAKAFFLKRVHALPYGAFAVGQVALLLMIMSANGAVGLAILATAFPEQLIGIIGVGFGVMTAAGALLLLPGNPLPRPLRQRLRWDDALVPDLRRAWLPVGLLQVGILLTTATSLWICFAMGTSEVPFSACAVFSAAAMLTRFVAITPGAIGIREFLVGGLAHLTGFELRDAVIASTAARSVEVVVVFALGSLFTRRISGTALSS